jgi:hypothetical protein
MTVRFDGPVTTGTRRNLIEGVRAERMDPAAVDAILHQVVGFTERVVEAYGVQVAAGEVGNEGSAIASEEPILGDRPPTALLYGRVQSGKTAAMILSSALCLDNGFRIVVVLTADSIALVEQTASRFKTLDGPRVFSTAADDRFEWEGQENELAQDVSSDGIVLVCAKDSFHLPRIIQFLQDIDASGYPAIVFDDEADAATPDTTLAARSSGRPTAPAVASTIHRRVIENEAPGQEGESISEMLPHSLYVQVTATPFILFLQRRESRIRPNTTFLLEPGVGYCGGEKFFAGFDSRAVVPEPPIALVPDTEAQAIPRRRTPQGLAASIDFFLVASAASAYGSGRWPRDGYKHLAHTSPRQDQHTVVLRHVERHLYQLRRQLREEPATAPQLFDRAYQELRRTMPEVAPLDDFMIWIQEGLKQVEFLRVNATANSPEYGPRINFIVGGNILGRGLTIDGLLVTYYLREAQTPQMDTVWQHARMYGYRESLMPYTRVYLPKRLASLFKEIHESEEALREVLRREASGETVPIRVAAGSRPTRPNATEPAVLQVFPADLAQIFPHFLCEDSKAAAEIMRKLRAAGVPIGQGERDARTTSVPTELVLELVDRVPVRDGDPGKWNVTAVRALIEDFVEQHDGSGYVYVRGLEEELAPQEGWVRGRLSGPEITIIRDAAGNVPALALLHLGDMRQPRGWYPTLVLPRDRATYIINSA